MAPCKDVMTNWKCIQQSDKYTRRETVDSNVRGSSPKSWLKRISQDRRELRKLAGKGNAAATSRRWSRKKEILRSRTVMEATVNWEAVNPQGSLNQKPEPVLVY